MNNIVFSKRIIYIDNMRGIAILLVMLGHSIGTVSEPLNQLILSFHMPLFFFISGLSSSKNRMTFFTMLKKYVFTMLVPIISMGIINILVSIIIDVVITKNMAWHELQYFSFFKNWFLWSMFIVKLLQWIKEKVSFDVTHIITAAVELSVAVCLYVFKVETGIIMQALVGAFFFDLGIVLKKKITEIKADKFFGGGLAVSMLCLLSYANNPIMMYANNYGNFALFLITSMLGIFAVLISSKMLVENKLLNFCSDCSIILYMIHPAILRFLHKLTSVIFGNYDIYPNYYVTFVLLFIISVPSAYIIRKYIPFLFGKRKDKKS